MSAPFFTIITSTLNSEKPISGLLESVASQKFRDFEMILQDGSSKDKTLQVAEGYVARIPNLRIFSEPDMGIYDAWNKAIKHASGEWVIFLGADDEFAGANVLEQCHTQMKLYTDAIAFAVGEIILLGDNNQRCEHRKCRLDKIPKHIKLGCPVPHTAMFTKRSLFAGGAFDDSFKIAGDYDFIARNYKGPWMFAGLPLVISHMGGDGISSSTAFAKLHNEEKCLIAKKYFGFLAWLGLKLRLLIKGCHS